MLERNLALKIILLNQVYYISRIDQNKLNYNILMFEPQIISKENKENQNFKMLTN